ncbi:MAG: Gfo/Idh/MocA family oxidoreductase [bacterium]
MKIAVIGAGRWGRNHIKTLSSMGSLAAVIDNSRKNIEKIQSDYPDCNVFNHIEEEGALDYDAYVVAVPAEHHYTIAKTCLTASKPVLVEKPITLNSQEAKELCALADSKKQVLMTGHLLLFHPAIQKIKKEMLEGRIGKLQYMYSNRLNLGTVRKEENSLWSFAPHDLSIFQYFTDKKPEDIESRGGAFLQPGIHDTTITCLKYPDNIVAHSFVSWLHPFKEHRLVVIGDKGMFVYEDSTPKKELLFYEKGIDWVQGEPVKREGATEVLSYEEKQPLEAELQHFIDCIRGKEKNEVISGRKGVDVLEVLEQAQDTLENKSSIKNTNVNTERKIHSTVCVHDSAKIGKGTAIWNFSNILANAEIGKNCILGQNVNIGTNVKIGNHCKIQNNVSVYEGVELQDYVFCGPSMVFTNINMPRSKYPQAESKYYVKTLVKEGASIGANATIVCGVTLGRFCMVGAGAVVTKDVPNFALVVGNPARVVGWVSEGGKKLEFDKEELLTCAKSGKQYRMEEGKVVEVDAIRVTAQR